MTDPPETPGPRRGVATITTAAWPLFASIALLMTGAGLQGSLLGVRADQAAFSAPVIGLVLGLYYLGYVAGSLWVPPLIRAVGHIRVFGALASLASTSMLLHGIWVVPPTWMVLRLLTGLCVSGLFIVSESWLNDVSDHTTRASLLAVYNSVVTAGLAAGSLLLNVADAGGFVLFAMGSVLVSLAAVPVALAPHEAPSPHDYEARSLRAVFRSAPLGVMGSTISGFTVGASVGFGAVYAVRAGFGVSGASQFVATLLLGAIVGQIPLGRLSDRTDRRYVMGIAGLLVSTGAAVGIGATEMASLPVALASALLIGAGGFALYGLSFAHVADYVPASALTATGARLVTVNGLGAAAGPITTSIAIALVGPNGLFGLLATCGIGFTVSVIYRLTRRSPVPDSRRTHYLPVASSTTVAALEEIGSELSGVELGGRKWFGRAAAKAAKAAKARRRA